MQCVENKLAIGLRHRRKASLHLGHRELRIVFPQGGDAAARFRLGADQYIGWAHGSMDPDRRRMFSQGTLLPTGCLGIAARSEMCAAYSHKGVECEGVVRRELKRDLEPLDDRFGIAVIYVDPSATAPGPSRAAVNRERLADDQACGFKIVKQSEGVAENSQYCRVPRQGLCFPRQLCASSVVLRRRFGKMIDDALPIRPRGERGCQRIVRIAIHRALQKIDRARIAVGFERKNMRHRPERQVVRAQVAIWLSMGTLNLRKTQRWLKRRRNSGGKMLVGSSITIENAIGTIRREVAARSGLDQSKDQARLL